MGPLRRATVTMSRICPPLDLGTNGSTEMNRVRGKHQPRIAFGRRDGASGCGRFASADALGRFC